jgi:hypothetical protein
MGHSLVYRRVLPSAVIVFRLPHTNQSLCTVPRSLAESRVGLRNPGPYFPDNIANSTKRRRLGKKSAQSSRLYQLWSASLSVNGRWPFVRLMSVGVVSKDEVKEVIVQTLWYVFDCVTHFR